MNASDKAKAPRNFILYAAIKPRSSTARFTFVRLPQAAKALSPGLKEVRKPRQFNVFGKACAMISCGFGK
jgi:hypothetical protein